MGEKFILRSWSHSMTQRLKEMWWAGHSPAFIALTIGAANARAVTEKAHRSGFKRDPAIDLARNAHKIADHLVPRVREDGTLTTIATIGNRECRYMYGEPGIDAPMCGRPAVRNSCCAEHLARCYQRLVEPI